jgi:C4/C10 protein
MSGNCSRDINRNLGDDIKEFGMIDEDIQNEIYELVNSNKTKFEQTDFYSGDVGKRIIDPNFRLSRSKVFNDIKLYDLINKLLTKLNSILKLPNPYFLIKEPVKYIVYTDGGHFKTHTDLILVDTFKYTEYTMILCLDANCTYGETIFHFDDGNKYTSNATTTPKHSIIFKKDIAHEGNIVKNGYKKILSFNIKQYNRKKPIRGTTIPGILTTLTSSS